MLDPVYGWLLDTVVVTSEERLECMQHDWGKQCSNWNPSLYRPQKDQGRLGNSILGRNEWEFRCTMDRSPED